MHVIPVSTSNETVTVEVELRIGRTASRTGILTAAGGRLLAQALIQEAES